MWKSCPVCKKASLAKEILLNQHVCPECRYHFRLPARERLRLTLDENSFEEFDRFLTSDNRLGFPDYDAKIESARKKTGENEAVLCGVGSIGNKKTVVCAMEPDFIMGSMGCVVGEKITRAFEYAKENRLPVIAFCASGGARMQEGVLSLMQMAKTSGAVKHHSDSGLLYISVLTNPTTGGVTASFAMEGDILLAEPAALIGFAGPRVIEQTMKQTLPEGFQSAEFILEKGFLDAIVPRNEMKSYLANILLLHSTENEIDRKTIRVKK
jgi:acetyl-CoA carboxylase carboxyl transferase subunit beta